MAIYKRGKNWYVDFTFHGERVREMIGPSRKTAQVTIAKRKAEIAENKFLDVRKEPDPVRFYDFCKEYLQWAKANKKASSYGRDISTMRQLNKEFEKKNLHEITTWQVEKWKAKRKEKLKPASVNKELGLLKHIFVKGVEWGKLRESPAKGVKLLKGEVKRLRYLMPDEIRRLLSNCADHLKPIVTIALNTGMRRGELLSLKWEQINFEQGIITLFDTKNHERRDIPMNETVKAALGQRERNGDHIFCNGDGETYHDVRTSFATALRKSGIEDFRWHDLRHCFASNLVMAGVDINTVRELMGHKTLAMTLRYAHLAPSYKTRAVNILDQIIGEGQVLAANMSLNPPHREKVCSVVSLTH